MKTTISLIRVIFLIIFISGISFGQNNLSQNKLSTLKVSEIKLNISLKEKQIKKGEPFELAISIQNNFSKNIELPYDRYDDLGFGLVEIRDAKNNLVKRLNKTLIEQPDIRSWTSLGLIPNEKVETTLQLSRFFNLAVGKYLITTSFTVVDIVKREKFIIKSNTETLKVIE